jgi:potassium efflux system protein
MSTLRTYFAIVLLGLSLSVGVLQAADLPTSESVQQSLDKIAARKLPEADQKALQAILQQTLTQLANQQDYEQKLTNLKQQLSTAPRQWRSVMPTCQSRSLSSC